jgi:hypothetical protein
MNLTPKFSVGQKREAKQWMAGLKIAELLRLKPIDRGELPCGFDTGWGMKSALGLYLSIKEIMRGKCIK